MAGSNTLWCTEGALEVPDHYQTSTMAVWCDFGIWGLVLFDDQTPWFTLVECIQILSHRHRESQPLFPGLGRGGDGELVHERMGYSVPSNKRLRHLLFRDQEVARLSGRDRIDDAAVWREWLEGVKREVVEPDIDFNFDDLQTVFSSNFKQFADSLELLRSAEVEKFGAKRWTSRHLLPLGDAMLLADVDEKFKLDRRFFQRTGEILYLMLNRSRHRETLQVLLHDRLLTAVRPWSRIASRIQGVPDNKPAESGNIGYLPMASLPIYDTLAEDWIAILSQSAIPIEDSLDLLMRLSGLAQVVYIVERACAVSGRTRVPPFALDMTGSARKNPVFTYASDQYKAHKSVPHRAVEAFVGAYAETDEWQALGNSADHAHAAKELLKERFAFTPKRNTGRLPLPDTQLKDVIETAKKKNHDIGSTLTSHARRIGLLNIVPRTGTWYAPSDALLEALVLANVRETTEFGQFLRRLHTRYHVVVGPEEARAEHGELPVPLAALKENERRLEERLRVLGFVDRKSDDCAFVVNPYHSASAGQRSRVDAFA